MTLAGAPVALPSPTVGVLHLGPLTLSAAGGCLLIGVAVGLWVCVPRLAAQGLPPGRALDSTAYPVVLGVLGARLQHVVTTPQPYVGQGGRPLEALALWHGGLGLWGAVALGAIGVRLAARRVGLSFLRYADAATPGLALGVAVGSWGAWFDNGPHGGPTALPWGLTVHVWDRVAGRAVLDDAGRPLVLDVVHPTFLYLSLLAAAVALALVRHDRGGPRPAGRVLALGLVGLGAASALVDTLRTDPALHLGGVRVDIWLSVLAVLVGAWTLRLSRPGEGRDTPADIAG